MRPMTSRRPAPSEIERAFAQAYEMEAQIERKERSLRRRTAELAKALASSMRPGEQ